MAQPRAPNVKVRTGEYLAPQLVADYLLVLSARCSVLGVRSLTIWRNEKPVSWALHTLGIPAVHDAVFFWETFGNRNVQRRPIFAAYKARYKATSAAGCTIVSFSASGIALNTKQNYF